MGAAHHLLLDALQLLRIELASQHTRMRRCSNSGAILARAVKHYGRGLGHDDRQVLREGCGATKNCCQMSSHSRSGNSQAVSRAASLVCTTCSIAHSSSPEARDAPRYERSLALILDSTLRSAFAK